MGSVRDTHEPALPALHTSSFLDFANVAVGRRRHDISVQGVGGRRGVCPQRAAENPPAAPVLYKQTRRQFPARAHRDVEPHAAGVRQGVGLHCVSLSLWHPDNQYHLMNEKIVLLLVNLQSNPACTYTARGGFVCIFALTLFLLEDDADRNNRAVSSARLLLDVLAPNRVPALALLNTQRETHYVKRLTWDRGRLGFAVPLDRSVPRALRILREYARVPACSAPNATAQDRVHFTTLLMSRQHGTPRSITDVGLVAQACLATGVKCRPCCDFGARGFGAAGAQARPRLQALAADLANADILLGAHGAAMSLVLFARRGAITINVMPEDENTWNVIFPRMAVVNQGLSVIALVPSTARGMQVSYASACGLLECACALLAGSAQTPCILPHVSVLSHRDLRDEGEVEQDRHHGFGSTPPRPVSGRP